MTHIFRTIILVSCLAVLHTSPTTGDVTPLQRSNPPAAAPSATPAGITARALTDEQQELVEQAQLLFRSAGLALPAVTIEFPTEPDLCFENGGVYIPKARTVRICRPSLKTMVHELAHSWVETTLTASERKRFLDLRELETWAGGEQWDERGAEHAAEIVTWAVLETDISVRWIYTNADGTTLDTTRLFKIAHTDHDELVSAYRQLTGELPLKRLADKAPNAEATDEIESPEARRAPQKPRILDEIADLWAARHAAPAIR